MTKKLKVFETGVSAKASKGLEYEFIDTREISGDIEEWELKAFLRVVSAELSPEQEDAIVGRETSRMSWRFTGIPNTFPLPC